MCASEYDAQLIRHLREAIVGGEHWYLALLKAVKLWSSAEEDCDGRHYRYLINGEAFDWLVLAERLCQEVDELIPEEELIALLFYDRPPVELERDEFRELIGDAKYSAYLNYLYGVLVEEVLIQAVKEEIRKEKRVSGLTRDKEVLDEAFRRIYGASEKDLLDCFRKEKHYPRRKSITVGELKEFTYWLFNQRVRGNDKSRVASDTKKALVKLHYYTELGNCTVS